MQAFRWWMVLSMLATCSAGCHRGSAVVDGPVESKRARGDSLSSEAAPAYATAMLGGGCFWCVESDFEKCPGVEDVVSGYSGGASKAPTYETYAAGGHVEVVEVTYDPTVVTFAGLVEWLIKHSDPTDPSGSFADRGSQYRPVVFYDNEQQQQAAQEVIAKIDQMGIYEKSIAIDLEPREKFWPAEDYHQDYHRKSLVKYDYYRYQSGRDAFITEHWGDRAGKLELPESKPSSSDVMGTPDAEQSSTP
ncbi:Peptide methionine sulfoxide reductase MsrA 2 [Allorhodopirellula heiligendammensis]|uniref:Peptide methionine sulfoxide reductase MsrA n=2 Tax=Allorhodopirellula heiligendammensis TaxID=2714739 RepID=A0A5C6BVV2_9BACT|nr:Peptide methionine sulfoxide reductase MsrA 2 [Allorhodopirellula heiligendammensis]